MENSKQIPIIKPRKLYRKQISTSTSFSFHETAPIPIHDEVYESEARQKFLLLSSLPPGYRFMPSDTELIRDYLRPKIANQKLPICLIHPVNLYHYHPKTLEERYLKHPHGQEVYYFSPRDRKYRNGKRPNRSVEGFGYWKANGADVDIKLGAEIIGYKKTLVFYEGKSPGNKTNWIMHELRTCESRKRTSNADMKLDDWVLCRIREKEETGHSRNKNNEDADAKTNISDTDDTENDLMDPIAVNDDNVLSDYDEEDNCLNSKDYCSTSYHNQITDHNEEDNLLNANVYGSTSCHNQVTDYNEEEHRLNANDYGSTSYHNQITDYNLEEHRLNANDYGSTSYHNQITDYNLEDHRLNATYGSTYHDELYQSHQDMGPPPLHQSSPYLFDTCQGNFNMINNNYASGGLPDELIFVPRPSNTDELVTDGLDLNGQWASRIICDNGFDTFCVDLDKFQGCSTGVNIKDADDEKQMELPEN